MAGGSKSDKGKVAVPTKVGTTVKVSTSGAKEAPPSPASTSSAASFSPSSLVVPIWKSPSRRSKAQIRQVVKGQGQDKRLPGWYLRSMLLDGGVEAIFITTSNFAEDAYFDPLVKAITAGIKVEDGVPPDEDPGPVSRIGLTGAYYMRNSLDNPDSWMNPMKKKTGARYQRKVFIRLLDPDEGDDTVESRLEALKHIKEFMERKANNGFNAKVFIQQPGWDMPNKDSMGQLLKGG
jgi:hypothetical protein